MKITSLLAFLCSISLLKAQDGLIGEYYNGTNFDNKVMTRTDPKIEFGWWQSSPQNGVVDREYYSVRWTGKLLAPETGKYLFSAKVDDGIRLWVNNVPLINAWDLNNMGDFSNHIMLEKNKTYTIKVEYFNAMREGEITLLWQTPSQVNSPDFKYANFKPVSDKYLYQPNTIPKLTFEPVIASKKIEPKKTIVPQAKPATPSVSKATEAVKPATTFEKMDKDLTVKQVFFVRSVNKMTDNSLERLDKVVDFLKNRGTAKIELNGHTDVMGDAQKNIELSISRTQVVADYLISKGVADNRIISKGFGGSQPIVANPKTEDERALNRRVEFVIKQ
jgi:outer membrane protein OmpA-like peptidoglycan-associated protein